MHRLSLVIPILFALQGCGSESDLFEDLVFKWDVASTDLDQDGTQDLIFLTTDPNASPERHLITVFLNNAGNPGEFVLNQQIRIPHEGDSRPVSVALGDLNGDGFTDLAVQNRLSVFILFQKAGAPGRFEQPVKYAIGWYTSALAIGDLNQDGLNDLAITGGQQNLSILLQDSLNPGNFLPRIKLGIISSEVAIGDFNGDLINDLAFTGNQRVTILVQDAGVPGTFTLSKKLDAGAQPAEIAARDLDMDGRLDLVVVNRGSGDGRINGSVSVFLQDPTAAGDFLPVTHYRDMQKDKNGLAVADLNHDGALDIAVGSNFSDYGVALLFQNLASPGTFNKPKLLQADDFSVNEVASADFDNDGFNDLVVIEQGFVLRYQKPSMPGTFARRKIFYNPK